MAEHAQRGAGGHGAVGQHDVELVQRQVAQQRLVLVFVAHQAHRGGQLSRDLEQAVGSELGQRIGNAHRQTDARAVGSVERFLHLLAQQEYLVGIRQRQAACFGQCQAPALLGE